MAKPDVYRAPRGTQDLLPPASGRWEALRSAFGELARRYGYAPLLTPVFEHREVFERVGEHTDVIRKEMYEFDDRGGRRLALRPEGTAPVVRAFVEHRPVTPWKVWYCAPHFRYERAQKGRYRQHWQLGAEALGADDPALDVEVIDVAAQFLRAVGLRRCTLLLNSMGDAASRPGYRAALQAHLRPFAGELGPAFAELVEANPLRVLDSKDPAWQPAIRGAPRLDEHLSEADARHFEAVRAGLDAIGVAYRLEPRLVRGFDYYTRTAFEFTAEALDAAQNAVGGGGRYDGLAAEMGGPPTPGIGFGIGMERLLLALDAEAVPPPAEPLDVFVVDGAGGTAAVEVLHALRAAGLSADRAYGRASEKAQFKAAARAAPRATIVLRADGAASLRVGTSRDETAVPAEHVVAHAVAALGDRP